MKNTVKWTENGGVVANKEVVERDTTQKNYVIEKEVAKGIKALSKQFAVNESRMVEEMYYTFIELLERGKETKKTNKTTKNTKANTETKKEK